MRYRITRKEMEYNLATMDLKLEFIMNDFFMENLEDDMKHVMMTMFGLIDAEMWELKDPDKVYKKMPELLKEATAYTVYSEQ